MYKRFLAMAAIFIAMMQAALAGVFYVAPALTINEVTIKQSSYAGLNPRLTLGYSAAVNPWLFLAGEVFGTFNGIVLQDAHPAGTYSAKTSWGVGVGVLPGIRLSKDTLGFLRLGVIGYNSLHKLKPEPADNLVWVWKPS